jgi:hypothetical protein
VLTQYQLKEVLHYCPETGVFTWLVGNGKSVKAGDLAGGADANGYFRVKVRRVSYKLHKLAFLYMSDIFPPRTLYVDHIDGNKLNNAWSNLRLVTPAESNRNRRFASGELTGIERTSHGRYRVRIRSDKGYANIGTFGCLEIAKEARDTAYLNAGYHPNHGTKRRT